ncbi:DC-STAMP-like protein [Homalodisca vitripennis]|nr:DC-STAMP-like protein [Homalodisca vitripennis]
MCILFQVSQYLLARFKLYRYLRLKKMVQNAKNAMSEGANMDDPSFAVTKAINRIIEIFKLLFDRLFELYKHLSIPGSIEHYVIMAIVGLCIGTVISVNHYYFEVYTGSTSVFQSFVITLPIMVLITICISFTECGRCFLLITPILMFSGRGQVYFNALVALLIVTGPMANVKHNLSVMQESSVCQQRGVAEAAESIADILFGPFAAFHKAAEELAKGIKRIVDELQEILRKFKRKVMAITDAISEAGRWINSKINGCKNSVGSTYDFCVNAFTGMQEDCRVKLPTVLSSMCNTVDISNKLCSAVQAGNLICDLVYFDFSPLMNSVKQRITRLWDRAFSLVYFKINIHHHYNYESNHDVILGEIKQKVSSILTFENMKAVMDSFLYIYRLYFRFYFLYAIFLYRSRYLKKENYDNYFITTELVKLDKKLLSQGKVTIFPLRSFEKRIYTKACSPILMNNEYLAFSFPSAVINKTVGAFVIIGLDYFLYYIVFKSRMFMLAMMQSFGTRTEVSVVGSGFIAELSRRVVRALNFLDYNFYATNFMPCVPNPKRPDFWRALKIIGILVFLLFSWISRPFMMRLRHMILDYYHPDVAKRRAIWLHNTILLRRMSFLTIVTAKIKGKFTGNELAVSFSDKLRADYPWIRYIIGRGELVHECIVCNDIRPPLVHCTEVGTSSKCVGIYCKECYYDIGGICPLCSNDMDKKGLVSKTKKAEAIKMVQDAIKEDICIKEESPKLDYTYYSYQAGFVEVWKENIPTSQHTLERYFTASDNPSHTSMEAFNKFGLKYQKLPLLRQKSTQNT